jgi:Mor family transcriptional regulator
MSVNPTEKLKLEKRNKRIADKYPGKTYLVIAQEEGMTQQHIQRIIKKVKENEKL